MFTFTPLYRGTIRRLFEWKPPATNLYDPRALPQIEGQCVHIDCTYIDTLDGGQLIIKTKRCVKDATVGFLCSKHDWQNLSAQAVVKPHSRDTDLEVSEGIIKYEGRELQARPIQTIQCGRMAIRVVEGYVGRPINPSDYSEYDRVDLTAFED